jgi:ribonucleotide reductase alpha subunit
MGKDDGERTIADDTEVGGRASMLTLLCELLHSDFERRNMPSAKVQAERLISEMEKGAVALPSPLVRKAAHALLGMANELQDKRWLDGYYNLVTQTGITPDPQTALRAREVAQQLKKR